MVTFSPASKTLHVYKNLATRLSNNMKWSLNASFKYATHNNNTCLIVRSIPAARPVRLVVVRGTHVSRRVQAPLARAHHAIGRRVPVRGCVKASCTWRAWPARVAERQPVAWRHVLMPRGARPASSAREIVLPYAVARASAGVGCVLSRRACVAPLAVRNPVALQHPSPVARVL
jgi:hypothetical protein